MDSAAEDAPSFDGGLTATWMAGGAGGPGYNRRTPGGDLMSDGNCAFIAGVPAGNCQ